MKINAQLKEELKKYLKEREKKEKEKVYVTSSHKLSSDERQILIQKLPSLKNTTFIENIDPELLAGVVVKKGSRILDLSLAGMIKNLRNTTHE